MLESKRESVTWRIVTVFIQYALGRALPGSHYPHIDPHAEFHPPGNWQRGIEVLEFVLPLDRTLHGGYHAGELG